MTPSFQHLMNEATRLTQGGQLQAAADVLQQALRGTAPGDGAGASSKPPSSDVIDVAARVVATEPTGHPSQAAPAAANAGGAHGADAASWSGGLFMHQGRRLGYKLFVPPRQVGSTAAAPSLVLMLHGCTQGADDFAAGTQMNALAAQHNVVVVYPEQTQHANAQKCWNWFKPQHQQRGRGEPELLAALTQKIVTEQAVDRSRVYVAGLSAGGAMADIVGRCYPDLFAAVGVHSGLPAGAAADVMGAMAAMRSGAPASAPVSGPTPPVIVFHGDADSTVHPSNGDAVAETARRALGASSGAAAAEVQQGRTPQGRAFTRTVYASADGRPAVEHWRLHGAGHAWSGGSREGSYTEPAGPDASTEMLRFFLAHPMARVR